MPENDALRNLNPLDSTSRSVALASALDKFGYSSFPNTLKVFLAVSQMYQLLVESVRFINTNRGKNPVYTKALSAAPFAEMLPNALNPAMGVQQ